MLATILRTPVADIMSIQIIDAFVYMRKYLSSSNKDSMLVNHENRILKLEESFDKMSSKQTSIIYDGKIYDAYSILIDILNSAKEEIIIIDNYANKELLDMLRQTLRCRMQVSGRHILSRLYHPLSAGLYLYGMGVQPSGDTDRKSVV